MNNTGINKLTQIYNALGDDISRQIYKRRLLYSLFGGEEEIQQIVRSWSALKADLSAPKICYYGAGAGCRYAMRYRVKVSFIIDGSKTGTLEGCPIISFEDFLKLPDFREYLVLITVGTEAAQEEIKAKLDKHGLRYAFVFYECSAERQYFEIRTLCPDMHDEYFVDAGALDGTTTKYFLDDFLPGGGSLLCV